MAKILVVDDSKTFGLAVKKILSSTYKDIKNAISGEQAIESYKASRPDLVLLDVTMPNMDGRECLEKIFAMDPSAKVIMVSAIQKSDVMDECLELGAKAFIHKSTLNAAVMDSNTHFLETILAVLSGEKIKRGA